MTAIFTAQFFETKHMKIVSLVVCSAVLVGGGGRAIVDYAGASPTVTVSQSVQSLDNTILNYSKSIDERILASQDVIDQGNALAFVATIE